MCHNEPGADLPPALLALNARAVLRRRTDVRELPLPEFFTGYFETALEPDEILCRIDIEHPPEGAAGVYLKHAISPEDLAMVGVAAVAVPDGRRTGGVAEVRIGIGGAAPVPLRAAKAEAALKGAVLDAGNGPAPRAKRPPPRWILRRSPCQRRVPPKDGVGIRAPGVASGGNADRGERPWRCLSSTSTATKSGWRPRMRRCCWTCCASGCSSPAPSAAARPATAAAAPCGSTAWRCTVAWCWRRAAPAKKITTVEGCGSGMELDRLQQSFLQHGAVQCGYCGPGMLMAAHALLEQNPTPTLDEVKKGLDGNLCRCTGYTPIFDAIMAYARGE